MHILPTGVPTMPTWRGVVTTFTSIEFPQFSTMAHNDAMLPGPKPAFARGMPQPCPPPACFPHSNGPGPEPVTPPAAHRRRVIRTACVRVTCGLVLSEIASCRESIRLSTGMVSVYARLSEFATLVVRLPAPAACRAREAARLVSVSQPRSPRCVATSPARCNPALQPCAADDSVLNHTALRQAGSSRQDGEQDGKAQRRCNSRAAPVRRSPTTKGEGEGGGAGGSRTEEQGIVAAHPVRIRGLRVPQVRVKGQPLLHTGVVCPYTTHNTAYPSTACPQIIA